MSQDDSSPSGGWAFPDAGVRCSLFFSPRLQPIDALDPDNLPMAHMRPDFSSLLGDEDDSGSAPVVSLTREIPQTVDSSTYDEILDDVNRNMRILGVYRLPLRMDGAPDEEKFHALECLASFVRVCRDNIRRIDDLTDRNTKLSTDLIEQNRIHEVCQREIRQLKTMLGQQKRLASVEAERRRASERELQTRIRRQTAKVGDLQNRMTQSEHVRTRLAQQVKGMNERVRDALRNRAVGKDTSTMLDLTVTPARRPFPRDQQVNRYNLHQDLLESIGTGFEDVHNENVRLREFVKSFFDEVGVLRDLVYLKQGVREYESTTPDIAPRHFSLDHSDAEDELEDVLKAKIVEVDQVLASSRGDVSVEEDDDSHDQFLVLQDILLRYVNEEDKFSLADKIVHNWNERLFFLQDLLSVQNELLRIDVNRLHLRRSSAPLEEETGTGAATHQDGDDG